MRLVFVVLGLGAAVAFSPPRADATCVDPVSDTALISVVTPTPTLSPAGPHPTLGRTLVASGNTLRILQTSTLASLADVTLIGTIQNTPNPVQLDDGSFAVFVARQDGIVSRINPISGAVVWSVSLRRGSCGSDSLSATPAVHLRRFASNGFKAAYTTDVVYVPTRYAACAGSTTQNRVYALRATDGSTVWAFNETGSVSMDIVSESVLMDIANDMLYVTSDRTASVSQHSLWAIDVLTGSKAWSANVGRILTAPIVRGEKIYIGTRAGEVKALNKDDGSAIWSVPVGSPILTNIFPEFRNPYPGMIGVVDVLGRVHIVQDNGLSGTKLWTVVLPGKSGDAAATSRIAIDPANGKVYVGANNGNIYQLSIVDGTVEATRPVSAAGTIVGDASFVFEDTDSNGTLDDVRMIAGSNNGTLAKFCTPWAAEVSPTSLLPTATLFRRPSSPGGGGSGDIEIVPTGGPNPGTCTVPADCGVDPTECSFWACINKVCVARPDPVGTLCDDGNKDTYGDDCQVGACSGTSICDSDYGLCTCLDQSGNNISRRLALESGQTGDGGVATRFETTNSCLTIGSNTRSAVYIHMIDRQGRPFTKPDELEFTMTTRSGTLPQWRHPVTDTLIDGDTVRLGNGLLETNRQGTFYAVLGAPPSGQPSTEPIEIRVRAVKGIGADTCINTLLFGQIIRTFVRVEAAGPGGVGGCDLVSDSGESGYLRVQVLRGDTEPPQPADGAAVMLGFAKNATAFHTRFDRFIDPAPLAGDATNVVFTDSQGFAVFQDYGNRLNGPFIVTAGLNGDPSLEFARVTIDELGAADVVITLPVARSDDKKPRFTDGFNRNPIQDSDGETLRLSLVAQRRSLGFFAGTDVDDMFDGQVCTTQGDLIAENAFVGGEEPWDKTFEPRVGDTLVSAYHAVDRPRVLRDGVFSFAEWARTAVYEQLGFLDIDIVEDQSGVDIPLGNLPAAGAISFSVAGAPSDADILGMTLTDYSTEIGAGEGLQGRGAGDIFMQGHASALLDKGSGALNVPFFDLDDDSLPRAPGNAQSWNIAQVEALYLMDPPCDSSGDVDPRCGNVPPGVQNARTSSLIRTGSNCGEPWDGDVREVFAPPFLELLDLQYSPAGGGEYNFCAGNDRDKNGICCAGNLVTAQGTGGGLVCDDRGEDRTGHYMKHTFSLVERSYFDPGDCTDSLSEFTHSYPYWVFYSPGEGEQISVPDLPAEFDYACGGVDTSACPANTRMGLPTRVGSGADCSQCESGEECETLDGGATSVCVVRGDQGELIVRDYEWRAELYNLDLVGDSCQAATPCDATALPVANGSFSGSFAFDEAVDCLAGQSTNVLIVN